MARTPGVFIVDQDPDARYQVQQAVGPTGFAVSGAAGVGTEAVSQIAELKPDIILCGLREPISRVMQTIESITHLTADTPVIVYANSSELEMIRKAMLAGARDFLQAPLKAEELKRSLAATLESEERRQLREAGNALLGPEGAVVSLYGAKGGVGKTTIAANLAVALVRRAGQSAVLIDADDTFGDVADALSLTPRETLTDVLRELDGVDGEELRKMFTHHRSGLAVVPGPANPLEWRGVSGERLQTLVRRLARLYDVVVIDSAGTLSDVSQALVESSSLVLWLTTLEYASVRNSLQALQALQGSSVQDDRVRLLLNVASPETEIQPNSIEEALGHRIYWTVPYDRLLRQSTQLGETVIERHPGSASAESLAGLALALNGLQPEARKSNGRTGLLRRLFGGREPRVAGPQPVGVREETTL